MRERSTTAAEIADLSKDTFWANNVYGYGGALNNVFGTIGAVTDDTFVGNSVNDQYGQGGAIEQDNGKRSQASPTTRSPVTAQPSAAESTTRSRARSGGSPE